jgi:hypothetical protein
MSIFSKLHEVLIGTHVFPQPKRKMWPAAASNNGGQSNLRAEDGYVPESRIRSGNYLKLFGFLFTVVVLVSAASAQSGGSIAGSVKDPTGAVIPGSEVVLLNPATGVRQTAVTDGSGNFDFLSFLLASMNSRLLRTALIRIGRPI